VDLVPVKPLRQPVSLATLKQDGTFSELALLRQSRLSVMPVTAAQFARIIVLAG
jgi:predicted RNA-binding protein with PUA-like domain